MKFAIFLQDDSQTQAAINGLRSEYGNSAKVIDDTTLEVWDAISPPRWFLKCLNASKAA